MEERERIVEVEREPVVERSTTVVTTGGGSGGGGMALVAVVLLIVGLVVLYMLFMRGGDATDGVDLNVKVETPDVDLPSVTPSKE
jgi:predicted metalloprotease